MGAHLLCCRCRGPRAGDVSAVFPVSATFLMKRKTAGVVNISGAPGRGVSINGGAAMMNSAAKDEWEYAASTTRVRSCLGCPSYKKKD